MQCQCMQCIVNWRQIKLKERGKCLTESVPASDTRQLAEAHGAAEMRVFDGGGHRLRHDPRAMAVLLGWLDRQRLGDEEVQV